MILAFHSDPAIKEAVLSQVAAHRAADEIIKGRYWENGKGCAIGCLVHSSSHAECVRQFGGTEQMYHLIDAIFEGLPNGEAKLWPERVMSAMQPGADLTMVWPRFAVWLLTEFAPSPNGAVVAGLYSRRIAGDEPTMADWTEAARAAGAAEAAGAAGAAWAAWAARAAGAAEAAGAAGAAWAAWAARAAAWAARAAGAAEAAEAAGAAWAAWAARAAGAAEAAGAAAYRTMAGKLCQIIGSAP